MPDLVVIEIDRSGMPGSPVDLRCSTTPGDGLYGIVRFQEPPIAAQVFYADDSEYDHDSEPRGWKYPEVVLGWDFVTDQATTEQDVDDAVAAMAAAITQGLDYQVTVTKNGATPKVYICRPGNLSPAAERSNADLTDHNPVWQVTLPCHPARA